MKLQYPARLLMISFYLCLFFTSCVKKKTCPDTGKLAIEHNGPIYSGWPLKLEASVQSTAYLYKWTGPNGWKQHYQIFASDAYKQQRENLTAADAGEYKLRLLDHEGCLIYEGSTIVDVIPAPNPTCAMAANTSTSSVIGVGSYSFVYRNFGGSSGHYFASGQQTVPGGHHMRFAFLGDNPPIPGVYKTSGFFALEPGQVGLYIETTTYQFVANPDQLVYVNKVNNKLELTFCSLKFNNPISPANPITISAKLTQP